MVIETKILNIHETKSLRFSNCYKIKKLNKLQKNIAF